MNVSTEQIQINHTSLLGAELLGMVETLCNEARTTQVLPSASDAERMARLIKRHTQMNVKVMFLEGIYHMGICVQDIAGHAGITGDLKAQGITSGKYTQFEDKLMKGSIDLKKVRVEGDFQAIEHQLLIGEKFFDTTAFSPEEITAGILHEIGHGFWSLATLGDYVWLNYFLTDGVESLLNKKSQRYRSEVIDIGYLQKSVSDPALRQSLQEQPTEAHLRRAILDVKYNRMRGHLHSVSNPGSWKRGEQMADWFSARMGFARPLASFVVKVERTNRSSSRFYRSGKTFAGIEIGKILLGMSSGAVGVTNPGLGLIMIGAYVYTEIVIEHGQPNNYDNPTERVNKLRRELIAQLKDVSSTPVLKDKLVEDITFIDNLLKSMNQHTTLLEALSGLLVPGVRRIRHQLKFEEQLEALLNNDLFVHAQRFR